MTRMRRLGCVGLVALAGCLVPTVDEVEPGRCEIGSFDVELPEGWLYEPSRDWVAVVPDHVLLSQLMLRAPHRESAFPEVRKDARADMSAVELAEVALEETRAQAARDGVGEVVLLETSEIEVAGRPAFSLHLRVENDVGLSFDHLQAGFVHGERFYWIWYRAPTLHYFQRDRFAFDRAIETLRPR